MESEKITWIRKLTPLEVFYEIGHQYGILITGYQATLNSKKPIKSEDVRTAVHWLYRKSPPLRLCIRENAEKELWFVEMEKECIEFKTFRHESSNKMLEAITHESFDVFNGPLWRATFIEDDNETPCPLTHLSSEFPFQSQFIFGIHHAITDGVSNLYLMKSFLQILNNIIGGIQIEEDQIGEFSFGEQTNRLLDKRKAELMKNPELYEAVQKEVVRSFTSFNTMWLDAFGEDKSSERKTLHLGRSLDLDTSRRLHQNLKAKGVSINSGACSVMNLTLLEMMKERGVQLESFNIGTLHGVNMRQYWVTESKFPLGLQIGMMRVYIETKNDASNDFWKYTKQFQELLQEKVKSKWALNESIVQDMLFPQDVEKLREFITNEDSPHTLLYTASSLGNVDRVVDGNGDHVQWTCLTRSTSAHKLACPLAYNFQLFRNIFCYSIEYSSHLVTKDVAYEILDRITNQFLQIANGE